MIRVFVTEQDILLPCKGKRSQNCPVQRGIQRHIADPIEVSFTTANIGLVVFALPPIAAEFITKFDNGQGVSPFNFDLEIEGRDLRLVWIDTHGNLETHEVPCPRCGLLTMVRQTEPFFLDRCSYCDWSC